MEIGRIVVKLAGRDAGRLGVIVRLEGDRAEVTGPKSLTGLRRRLVNISHLEPTPYKIEISEGASDEEVLEAIEKAGLKEIMTKRL